MQLDEVCVKVNWLFVHNPPPTDITMAGPGTCQRSTAGSIDGMHPQGSTTLSRMVE